MEQGRILVVGSINMDQVIRVPRLPAFGETLLGAGSLKLIPGGKGANQAVTMVKRQVSVLVLNENEASGLSGQRVENREDAQTVATVLYNNYGIPTVVITLGGRGALQVTAGAGGKPQSVYQAALTVQVIDTTAAGDCFVGALTVALSGGQAAADALRFAVIASALKVTKFGAQSDLPTRAEVEKAEAD